MKRIIAWNCADGFAKKLEAFESLSADVAVISEVRFSALGKAKIEPERVIWNGYDGHKGIAIICKKGWTVRAEPIGFADCWYNAAVVQTETEEFQVLGVWAKHKGVVGDPTFRAIRECASFFRRCPTIIAGDFNNNVQWDLGKNKNRFSDTLSLIDDMGLRSAWHTFRSERHGAETSPTLFWRRSPILTYHIDYVFVPNQQDWNPSLVEIGSYADWVASGLSDHVPIMVTV